MSGKKQVGDKLSRLAGRASRPLDYRLEAPDVAALAAAILSEVDEIVLGRSVDFTEARGGVLGLDIAGRRLLRVRSLPPGPGAEGFAAFLGAPLSGGDTAALTALHAALGALVSGGGAVDVTVRRLADPPEGADIGCNASALAAAWATADGPPEAPASAAAPGVAGFVAACAGRAAAWIVTEAGEVSDHTGPDAEVARLRALSQSVTPETGLGGAGPACAVFGVPGTAQLLFRGDHDGRGVLLICTAGALQTLLSQWRDATRAG